MRGGRSRPGGVLCKMTARGALHQTSPSSRMFFHYRPCRIFHLHRTTEHGDDARVVHVGRPVLTPVSCHLCFHFLLAGVSVRPKRDVQHEAPVCVVLVVFCFENCPHLLPRAGVMPFFAGLASVAVSAGSARAVLFFAASARLHFGNMPRRFVAAPDRAGVRPAAGRRRCFGRTRKLMPFSGRRVRDSGGARRQQAVRDVRCKKLVLASHGCAANKKAFKDVFFVGMKMTTSLPGWQKTVVISPP